MIPQDRLIEYATNQFEVSTKQVEEFKSQKGS